MDWRKTIKRARVPLGVAFSLAFLVVADPTWTTIHVSLPLVLAGLALRGYASGYLSKNRELATSGPYAHTRNPLYLGSILIAVGFAVAGLYWFYAVALGTAFFLVYRITIQHEERFLRGKFADYDAYVHAVPRLFPRFRPARLGGVGVFSRALYMKHREYHALIGVGAVYAALIVRTILDGQR